MSVSSFCRALAFVPRRAYKVTGEVWLWPGEAAWHFVGVDKKQSAELRERYGASARGFGSIPVTVTLGKTTWKTSIFPDKKSGTYLLPLKADVRRREGIGAGDRITSSLEVRL